VASSFEKFNKKIGIREFSTYLLRGATKNKSSNI